MARLIDADDFAKSDVFKHRGDGGSEYGMGYEDALDRVQEFLEQSPTVDAAPVVNGRWEWYADRCEDLFLGCDEDYGWRCNHCKTPLEDCDDPEVPPTFIYCPNCGAKMGGGDHGK